MKKLVILLFSSLIFASCGTSNKNLTEVKNPFNGSSYQSNKRWFRATASGESTNMETSKDKAMLIAKQRLASSIQTTLKSVGESYTSERSADTQIGDFEGRFQNLTREVLNQVLVDVGVIGEKVYQNKSNNFVTFIALEARKRQVYKKLKEIAKLRNTLSEKDKEYIQDMLNNAIKDLDDND